MRRGFTLIELLVATGVFLFGFTAAMALFLLGTRARAQADGMLRLSLAASSIVEEIRLEAGRETKWDGAQWVAHPSAPFEPQAYVGDGFAAIDSQNIDSTSVLENDNSPSGRLYPYKPQPGIWYRVLDCVDEKGDRTTAERGANLATALRFDLLVVWNPAPDTSLLISELAHRQGMDRPNPPIANWASLSPTQKVDELATFMAKRGFAVRETAWIIRKPSWER